MDPTLGLQILVIGATLGGVYALIALGFTLVFGIAKVLNLAHGIFYTISGYLLFTLTRIYGLNIFLAIVLRYMSCNISIKKFLLIRNPRTLTILGIFNFEELIIAS